MKKQYTKKQIQEAIKYWTNILNEQYNVNDIAEARHDGQLTRRHTKIISTDKPTIYYLGVDQSADFGNYGQYVMANGQLTTDASNTNFKFATKTKDLKKLKDLIDLTLRKYGNEYYIFVFKEEYSYGMQTHKKHARPSVIDIWDPKTKYWWYSLSFLDDTNESMQENTIEEYESTSDINTVEELRNVLKYFKPNDKICLVDQYGDMTDLKIKSIWDSDTEKNSSGIDMPNRCFIRLMDN